MCEQYPSTSVFPHEVADLYPTRPSKPLRATGFAPWDVAVGGVSAGIVRLLGLKSFDFGLAIAAADVTSANATLIVGDGRPRRMVSRLARVAGLVEPRLLASTDLDDIIWAVRSNEWQYVVLDRLELIRATSESIAELDDACFASDTVFIACGGDEVSTQPGLQGLFWRYAVQTVQLVAEYPGHGSGVFEIRVTDNPLSSSLTSNSIVRVHIPATGRLELVAVTDMCAIVRAIEVRDAPMY
jgi:hypothetical protein